MEELCPVCKKNPLNGSRRQKFCSNACRAAQFDDMVLKAKERLLETVRQQEERFDRHIQMRQSALRLEEQRRKCAEDELAMAQRLVEEAMADEAIREINDSSVKEVRLQLEQQRIVLVCGCGARTTIQIANDGHASLRTGSTE